MTTALASMGIDALLSRLDGVRRAGDGRWRARCPACGGKNSTKLSLRDAGDGRILIHCFGGCDVDAVMSALELDLSNLFPPRPADDQRRPRERQPFTAREAVQALRYELQVAWVLLTDVANCKPLSAADRQRAGVAAKRCAALLQEIGG